MSFFALTSSSSKPKFYRNLSPIRILVIGDSIANGTNELGTGENEPDNPDYSITGHARPNTLFEWNGSSMVEIENDVIDANNGSVWPEMANKLKELTGRKTHLVETATGGDGMARGKPNNWHSTGNRYAPMITKANSYLSNENVSKFDFICIIGGTNDVYSGEPLTNVEPDLYDLIDRLNIDFPNTKIVWSNIHNRTERSGKISGYINDIVAYYPNVYAGESIHNYATNYMFDGVHLTQEGNDLFGAAQGTILNSIL
jgi:hypothetical protein